MNIALYSILITIFRRNNGVEAMHKRIISTGIVVLIIVLSGTGLALAKAKYSNVTTVALKGGEYTDPAEAMNDFANWCGEPSLTNPCLLKIMPGFYDIGTSSVVMKRYVDIEGSGENVTKIKGNSSSDGVVLGASNAEIRFLSVQNTGGGAHAVAISNYLESPKITNVTAIASGGTTESIGIEIDHSQDFALTARNVTVIVSGTTINYGISNIDSNPTLINMNIKASGGSQNYGVYDSNDIGGAKALKIEHSIISGSTNSVFSQHVPAKIGNSRIEGGSAVNTICAGVYDANFIFYTNTCP